MESKTELQNEFIAELLKERIYATLALMGVLITIDPAHTSPLRAALLTSGTIVSLWAASLFATMLSRRVIFRDTIDHKTENALQLKKHAPMLATLVFPMLLIGLAGLDIISLKTAINAAIISSFLLIAGWSILSARSLNVQAVPTIIVVSIELLIGFCVVGLKVLLGH